MDDDTPIVGIGAHVVVGPVPNDEWAKLRCAGCGTEATIPIVDIPLVPGVDPVRDDDGVRLATCPRCLADPPPANRADRRKKR